MKVKVSKKELYECVENAVRKALNECGIQPQKNLEESWDDDDDEDDVLSRFLKDPKNDPKGGKKRMPGGGAAKKAAMKDIEDELKSQNRDDEIAAKHDISSKPKDDDKD